MKKIIISFCILQISVLQNHGYAESVCSGEVLEILAQAETNMDLNCAGLIYAISGKGILGYKNDDVRPHFSTDEKLRIIVAENCEDILLTIEGSQAGKVIDLPKLETGDSSLSFMLQSGERMRNLIYKEDNRFEAKVEIFPNEVIISGQAKDVRKGIVFETHFGIPSVEKFDINMSYKANNCLLLRIFAD